MPRPTIPLSPLFRPQRLLLSLACWLPALAAEATPDYRKALTDLQRAREEAAVLGTSLDRTIATNEAFFQQIPIESLEPRQIADLVRCRAFDYGDAAKPRAKIVAQFLEAPARSLEADGALALVLRTLLSSAAEIRGAERAALVSATLQHPAYLDLLRGEFGDLALDASCRAGMRSDAYRDVVAGLAAKLDAAKSPAAADSVAAYWNKVEQAIPEGEQRQAIRRHLVDYLQAVLTTHGPGLPATKRDKLTLLAAKLTSAAARGESLLGQSAPALHFLWHSEGRWQSLSDLRGKIVVLEFWTTWCSNCTAALPQVARLAERYRGTDVVVLGVTSLQGAVFGLAAKSIDCRGNPEKEMKLLADFIQAKAMTWPVVVSREPVFNPDYGVIGVPTTVLVDAAGVIRYTRAGFNENELTTAIDALLATADRPAPPPAEPSQ